MIRILASFPCNTGLVEIKIIFLFLFSFLLLFVFRNRLDMINQSGPRMQNRMSTRGIYRTSCCSTDWAPITGEYSRELTSDRIDTGAMGMDNPGPAARPVSTSGTRPVRHEVGRTMNMFNGQNQMTSCSCWEPIGSMPRLGPRTGWGRMGQRRV